LSLVFNRGHGLRCFEKKKKLRDVVWITECKRKLRNEELGNL